MRSIPIPKTLLIKWRRRNKQKFKLWKLLSREHNIEPVINTNAQIAFRNNWPVTEFCSTALEHRKSLCYRAEIAYEYHGCPLHIM